MPQVVYDANGNEVTDKVVYDAQGNEVHGGVPKLNPIISEPTFLSRLKEGGLGMIDMVKSVLEGPVPAAQKFSEQFVNNMATSNHPIGSAALDIGELGTGLPLRNIGEDVSKGNYGAAAGDVAIPLLTLAAFHGASKLRGGAPVSEVPSELPKLNPIGGSEVPLELPTKPIEPIASHAPADFGLKPLPSTNATVMDALLPSSLKGPDLGIKSPLSTNATVFDALLPESLKQPSVMASHSLDGLAAIHPPEDRPIPDIENSTPHIPNDASEAVIPKAGQAKPMDIGKLDIGMTQAELNSPNKVLLNYETTRPIVEAIVGAQDRKLPWINATLTKAAPFVDGLGNDQLSMLGKVLDGVMRPEDVTPDIAQRAAGLRSILDAIHEQIPPKSRPNMKDVGYLDNYFTHVANEDPQQKSLLSYFFGKKPELGKESGSLNDLYEQGLGDPNSPFVKTRTGDLTDINYNAKQVIRAYVQSIARTIFDKPAVSIATDALKNVPEESNLKDLATWYIKNYSGYDAEQSLHKVWAGFANNLSQKTARSFLDWNVPLHMLHLGEVPASVFPELGAKYTAIGMKDLPKNIGDMAQNGLIQGEVIPPSFRTLGEKYQTASQFFNVVERIVKGIAYGGAKQKFLDAGDSPEVAKIKAIAATKDMTYMVDPARKMKGLSPESNIMGGELASITGNQFRGVPFKIVEQYKNIIKNTKNDPAKTARLIAGASLAASGAAAGAHTFHMNVGSLISPTLWGAFGNAMKDVAVDLGRGDLGKAITDTVLWATPGGQQLKKLIKVL